MSRREFLRLVALTGALSGCRSLPEATEPTATPGATTAAVTPIPTPAPTPAATPVPCAATGPGGGASTGVAFVKTKDRSAGLEKAIDLLGINPVAGKTVFIKPNFNSSDPAPASTHPDTLRTLALKLREMGAEQITIGDRSGMGATGRVMEELGVFELAEELGLAVVNFHELGAEDWQLFAPPDSHWEGGFLVARPCLLADALVQVCCLKTHRHGGHFTMSLKNSIGMVAGSVPGGDHDYMGELHGSSRQRSMIAEVNTSYSPALIVLDGVEAFTTGGPDKGKQVASEVVLAGTDRIAIDAVGVALLRHFGTTAVVHRGSIFEQEQIARAVELGLGVDDPERIELITGDPDSAAYAEQIQEVLVSQEGW
jgi:uncharacterized protein (DUF362 family)